MSNLPMKPDKLTPTAEELARVNEILNSDASGLRKTLSVFATALAPMARHYAQLEAAKTPEQRAKETRQYKADAEQRATEKSEKQAATWRKFYEKWCLRDTWLLESEAVSLALEVQPSWLLPIIDADALLKLAISCAGYSLPIEKVSGVHSKWRVKPADWVRWLKEKGYSVNAQLEAITQPKVPEIKAEPQTARATESRERKKARRISDLKGFVAEVEQRARAANLPWDRTSIPVTKADFRAVFFKQYPRYRDLSRASFDNDFTEVGVKFRPGVRRKKNNVLKALFRKG